MVADSLSRVEAISKALDYAKLAEDQAAAPEIQALRAAETDLVLQDEEFDGVTVLCDVSTGARRPLVPLKWRRVVFDLIHQLSHAGPKPTTRAISQRFVWKNMKKDVNFWCQTCEACQASKVSTHTRAPFKRRELPDRRFGSLHLDIVGPLPESKKKRYLFTMIDRYSRWDRGDPNGRHHDGIMRTSLPSWLGGKIRRTRGCSGRSWGAIHVGIVAKVGRAFRH